MGQKENNTSDRKGKHLNWYERLILKRRYRTIDTEKSTVKQIAIIMGKHENNIKRELKRGAVTLQDSDLSDSNKFALTRYQKKVV